MSNNSEQPAFPAAVAFNANGDLATSGSSTPEGGLTKREYFAALAMQGLSANPIYGKEVCSKIATWSVEQADALLAALEGKEIGR
jgi:hypothetical protein